MEVRDDENLSMIERVAEAIWDSQAPPGAPPFHHLSNMEKFQVSLIARDCIKAMREPSPEMIILSDPVEIARITDVWQSMIDSALEEN